MFSNKKKCIFLVLQFLFSLIYAVNFYFEPVIKNPTTANNLCWNEDDSLFAYCENIYIIIRNSKTYEVVSTIQQKDVENICFAKEGKEDILITFLKNGQFSIWRLNKQSKVQIESVPYYNVDCKNDKEITATAISTNSDYLAVAYDDNTIKIFYKLRLINQTITFELGKVESAVKYLSFSKDNKLLLSGLKNGRVLLWNCTSNKLITFINDSYTRTAASGVISNEEYFAVPSDSNAISIYDTEANLTDLVFLDSSITAIKYLPYKQQYAVLTDNNKIHIISSKKNNYYESGYIFPVNINSICDFEFNSTCSEILVNYSDGSLYKFSVDDVFLPPNAEPPEIFSDHVEKYLPDFISFYSSASYINSEYFSFSTDIGTEYTHVIKRTPFCFGGGINCNLCFPSNALPYQYKIGKKNADVCLLESTAYGHVAYFINPPQKEYFITFEVKAGIRMINDFLFQNRVFYDPQPRWTFYSDVEFGLLYKALIVKFLYEYDTYQKFCPGLMIGGNIKIE